MDELIQSIQSVLPEAQEAALDKFINDAEANSYTLGATPAPTGEKLFSIPAKVTDPYQYNAAIASAVSDLAGLYASLDQISLSGNSMDAVNRRELDRVQTEVERLEGLLQGIMSTAASSAAYTHHIRHDFVSQNGDFSVLPHDLPMLRTDPETNCLTRPVALDISRITSVDRQAMCKVEIEQMLGTSVEGRHPVSEALDGSISTFWRESILADTPIVANKALVPWLASTAYSSGAALRLKFTFEAVTPISEIVLKPLADYPMTILDVTWSSDNNPPKDQGGAVAIGGDLSTWPGTWTATTIGTVAVSNPAEGQDGTKCLKMDFDGNASSRYKFSKTVPEFKAGASYVGSFRAKSSTGSGFVSLELKSNAGSAVLVRHSPTISREWALYSYVVKLPDGLSDSASLALTCYDTDLMWLDDIQVNTSCASIAPASLTNTPGTIVIPLSQDYGRPIMARTVWITLAQPNYNLRHYLIPRWTIETDNLWAQALENNPEDSGWATLSSPWRKEEDLLPAGVNSRSPLAEAAQRLGGRIKGLLAGLIRLSEPTGEMIEVSKYEYTFGAWEIDLRYKDFAPKGYWVSKPLNLRGEIRQMAIVPELGPNEADKVKFYILPHSNSPVDPSAAAELGSSFNVYFKPTTETGVISSGVTDENSTIIPVTPRQIGPNEEPPYRGTDRYKKVKLKYHPYFNAEKAAAIHRAVTAGIGNQQNRYDPNATVIPYIDNSAIDPTIRTKTGYNPIRVTLNVGGQVVPPDTLGRTQYTRYKVFRDEGLQPVVSGTTLTETRQTVTAGGTTASEENTTQIKVYRTSRAIAHLGGAPRITLYWHKVNTPDSQDILIDPNKYFAKWGDTTRSERSTSGTAAYADTIEVSVDPQYSTEEWSLVAYYRIEVSAGALINDPIEDGDLDYKYIPEDGSSLPGLQELALQSYPVTRNMTDYLTGKSPKLTPYNPDRSSKSYHPVHEYYVDASGNLIFASDLFEYGDNPAIITVEYETLDINPRILIAYDDPEIGTSTCSTPIVSGYNILINARV